MRMTRWLLSILISFSGYPAWAGTSVVGVTINQVATGWGGEGVYITINESVPPVEGCTEPRYVILPNAPLFEENVSFLLSAYHTQARINLYVVGCYSSINVHQISAVALTR